eukprot:14753037-Alexandrium_andersonii.AAC.1
MSASLVGSEMCIRDRNRRPQLASTPCKRALASVWIGVDVGGCGWMWVGAVSYTHLTLPTICSV